MPKQYQLDKPEPKLSDDSMMPFGKFGPDKGDPRRMADVPADYLLWLWDNGLWQKPAEDVHQYIANSWDALIMDAPAVEVKHFPGEFKAAPPAKMADLGTVFEMIETPDSSQIKAIGHHAETNTLRIHFRSTNDFYDYANFTAEDFAGLQAAESTGVHFYKHIKPFKDKHPYRKLS